MMRSAARTHIVVASLLTLLLLALSAIPAAGAEPKRLHAAGRHSTVRLVNCMRTGGYVTSGGKCKGKGSGKYSKYVSRLKHSDKISRQGLVAVGQALSAALRDPHLLDRPLPRGSTVDRRFRAVSLNYVKNGENMGCGMLRSAQPTALIIVRMWQRRSPTEARTGAR